MGRIIIPNQGPKPDEEGDYAMFYHGTGELSRRGKSGTIFNAWSFVREKATVMRFQDGAWVPQHQAQEDYNRWQEERLSR